MFCEMIPNTAIPSSRYPSGLLYRLNSDSSGSSLSPFLLDPEALEDPASCSASEKAAWRPYGPGLGSPTVVVSPAWATTTINNQGFNPGTGTGNRLKIWSVTCKAPPPMLWTMSSTPSLCPHLWLDSNNIAAQRPCPLLGAKNGAWQCRDGCSRLQQGVGNWLALCTGSKHRHQLWRCMGNGHAASPTAWHPHGCMHCMESTSHLIPAPVTLLRQNFSPDLGSAVSTHSSARGAF